MRVSYLEQNKNILGSKYLIISSLVSNEKARRVNTFQKCEFLVSLKLCRYTYLLRRKLFFSEVAIFFINIIEYVCIVFIYKI